jgi:hypothetical protein
MLIYKTRWFDRWARKERLTAPGLCKAVEELANGLFDADLGSGLFKKRVGRSRQGKRGGFRVLVATNKSDPLPVSSYHTARARPRPVSVARALPSYEP